MVVATTSKRLKELIYFTIPLVIGQVGQMLFNVGDIFVAGRYSTSAVASIGVAAGMLSPFIMIGISTLFSVSAVTARMRGEETNPHENGVWGSGMTLALLLGSVICTALYIFTYFVDHIGLNKEIVPLVKTYLYWVNISIIPALIFQMIKEYLQAFDKTIFANSLIIIMNVVNLIMNYCLMFGIGPIPEMGIKGAAVATVITRFVLAIIIYVYAYRVLPIETHFNKKSFKELIKLGIPVGLGTFIEVLMFSTVTVLIGRMSLVASASHNIVLTIAGLTFMVPLAINGAAGVKVGYALGRKDMEMIKNYSYGCIFMAVSYMVFTAICYFLFHKFLMGLFTTDQAVILYGSGLFLYVALFQIPDGLQVAMWGVLRGLGMSKQPMLYSFCGYWLIAIPVGVYLSYKHGMEAAGLWAGLAIGLTIVSMILSLLFKKRVGELSKEWGI